MATSVRASEAPQDPRSQPLRDAFDRATRWFSNLLAPLVIIAYAKEAEQSIDYIVAHPFLTGIFALAFIAILAYNVFKTLKLQLGGWPLRRGASVETVKAEAHQTEIQIPVKPQTINSQRRSASVFRWTAIAASSVALLIMAYAYVAVFVTGIYFVAVASAPDKESALSEVHYLNSFLEKSAHPDLKARAHPSTASGSPWYMISIGGWHTSKQAAEQTFQRAKKALGPRMRADAYIYSTQNASPLRVLVVYARRAINWIKLAFSG